MYLFWHKKNGTWKQIHVFRFLSPLYLMQIKMTNNWVEVLQSFQSIWVMLSRSVYLTTLSLNRLISLSSQPVLVHIHSPETDNCPSWISGRERMTKENMIHLHQRKLPDLAGIHQQLPDHQSDKHTTSATQIGYKNDHQYFVFSCYL